MRAIIITQPGGPDVLQLAERPKPKPQKNEVLIAVKAFGLNRAELYFRSGAWGDVAEISGIECAGLVEADPDGFFKVGQKVIGIMGGMGRTRPGSYAEYVSVPRDHVVALNSKLSWEDFAALPESYATAWTCLIGNLKITKSQTLVVRGGTSALGQAAINIAKDIGVNVIATTRNKTHIETLRAIGASHVIVGEGDMTTRLREYAKHGADAVLDLIGSTTLLDSLAMTKRGGYVCIAGFLGGGAPLAEFNPVFQMPGGVNLNSFASAFAYGTPDFPLSEVPFQQFVDKAEAGIYRARPSHILKFDQIAKAHQLMETNEAVGKIVILV